ncbi:nicotinate-nucleotide--dimethylbenzimidazole phosphoribosyltransferase [Streptomyces sp. NPDC026673]|uniref:nicotinate-nucleotide--dimethylbenzimidazole phosphoribosyltransferase n=1 Tax=Streptomyces sp. NPDC026673 TaxID=3155724 RepID=UPI003401A3DF
MTDTGQVPGEGLPENAGEEAVLQPYADLPGSGAQQQAVPSWDVDPLTAPVPPEYQYLDQPSGPVVADEDEEMLLMPGLQGSWADPQPVPPQPVPVATAVPAPVAAPVPAQAPIQVAHEHTAHGVPVTQERVEHDAHESGGRDSVSLDYSAVRTDLPAPEHLAPAQATPDQPAQFTPEHAVPVPVPVEPVVAQPAPAEDAAVTADAPVQVPVAEPAPQPHVPAQTQVQEPVPAAPVPPRRPLHMGPPIPDPSNGGGIVRSLADRGPATPPPAPAPQPVPVPMRQSGPPTTGPEYLDIPRDEIPAAVPAEVPGEVPATAPATGETWTAPAEAPTPEAVVPAPAPAPAPAAEPAVVPEPPLETPDEPLPFGMEPASEAPAAPEPAAEPEPAVAVFVPEPVVEAVPAPEPVVEPVAAPEPVAEAEVVVEAVAEPAPAPEPVAEAEPAPEPVVEPVPAPEPVVETLAAPEPVVETLAEPVPAVEPEAPVAVEEPLPAAVPVVAAEDEAQAVVAEPEPTPEPEPESLAEAEPETPVAGEEAPELLVPAAEGYDPAVRDAVHRVIRERRDIRNGFRKDPIPHEVLIRVLEAAHTAPSVGHSQPWDFVVIRSAKTRARMHELAMQQREAYAKSLPKGRAKQFRELKIEAILDTPVNIVVTADPTRGGRHTLGRYTQPQMAPYSSALAVENLWLAARAEGLGVGWVSFFDEREMVRELGLPEHLEVVAYLCVGYVDEFPEDPELVQSGWSKRRPLAWVVHEEEYGNRALPGEEPHNLLEETLRGIRPLDAKALGEAWERQKRMTKPAGALGMLEIISAQLSGLSRQCPPPIPEPAAVAIFAGDHGVHAQGVTAWPQEVTGQMVANFLGGGAVCNAFANQVGAEVCVIDVGVASELPSTPGLLPRKVRPGTADFTAGPAMTREEVLRAIEVGIETARDLVAAGNKVLLTGEMGVANTTVSAALISVYTGVDPAEVTGRGTGINDEMHARKIDVVRRALELHRPDPSDPIEVLAAIGGLEHAAMVGLLLGAASLRTPVILDGVSAGAAALVARAIAPEVLAACIAGHRSAEPGHRAALTKLGLRPLVDLDLRLGEGTGALLALPLVQSAARAMHEVATFDSAGVTEKS